MKYIVWSVIVFVAGYFIGTGNAKERVVYQTKTEYVKEPNSVTKSTLDTEVKKAKDDSYKTGYAEGRKIGIEEGYRSGYAQGTEYGQSIILSQIDLRIQEAEITNKNLPLFKIKRE